MKAKPSRWSAVRARPPPQKTRPTRPKFFRISEIMPLEIFLRGLFLSLRMFVEPALEHAHVAHVGAEHDVEGVAREGYEADHAVNCDIPEHPRRDVPGCAERPR